MNRAFEGIETLYSEKSYERISNAHILVVGIGGVGSWVCESLARSGVLNLTIVDMDEICVSNINRQVHALSNNIGQSKVDAMKERLKLINPSIKINTFFDFFSKSTSEQILEFNYDYVVDAFDGVRNKAILIKECIDKNIPIITIGAAGGKRDASRVEVKDLNRTVNDNLLAGTRRELKKHHGFWRLHSRPYKVSAVFSPEDVKMNDQAEDKKVKNCQTYYGSTSFVTGTFAFIAVSHILNQISGNDAD